MNDHYFYEITFSEKDLALISSYVHETMGIELKASKHQLIKNRLIKRIRELGLKSYKDYFAILLSNRDENIVFQSLITTNKTFFFREENHFHFLEKYFTNLHLPGNIKPYVRVWSAGCSSGEEVYSIAFLLYYLKERNIISNFKVLGTDINSIMLKKCISATYHESDLGNLDRYGMRNHLLKSKERSKGLIKIAPEIRERCEFRYFNLATDKMDANKEFDILFCRNVMIYFSKHIRNMLLERFLRSLAKDGILFVGHSESLFENTKELETLEPTIYRRRIK